MSFIVSAKKPYTPAPEGLWDAVCIDVVDRGIVKSDLYGDKHKCRIVWELSCKMEDGRPFTIQKNYTVSLHKKATLTKDLTSIRGKAFTAEELAGFDLEKVIGSNCQIVVVHAEHEGVVYGNVGSILKAGPNKLQAAGTYIRFKDRSPQDAIPSAPPPDEELPF